MRFGFWMRVFRMATRRKKKPVKKAKKRAPKRRKAKKHRGDTRRARRSRVLARERRWDSQYTADIDHNKKVYVARTMGTLGYDPKQGHMTYSMETGGLVKTPWDRELDVQTEREARAAAAKYLANR